MTRKDRGARSRSPGPTSAGLLTITQLSRRTAVPSSALRYYERIGLLPPAGRTKAGYRLYEAEAVGRVQFIRMAQDAGLTLDDIAGVLQPRPAAAGCAAVRTVLERRLEEIEAKIVQLDRLRSVLRSGLDCRPERASDLCRQLCAAAGAACACAEGCPD